MDDTTARSHIRVDVNNLPRQFLMEPRECLRILLSLMSQTGTTQQHKPVWDPSHFKLLRTRRSVNLHPHIKVPFSEGSQAT